MKEIVEEYGGVVTAALAGLFLLVFLSALLSDGGGMYQLVCAFFTGLGCSAG